jgi:hypothetical protein
MLTAITETHLDIGKSLSSAKPTNFFCLPLVPTQVSRLKLVQLC